MNPTQITHYNSIKDGSLVLITLNISGKSMDNILENPKSGDKDLRNEQLCR